MSTYKFLVKAQQQLQPLLVRELRGLGLKTRKLRTSGLLEVRTDFRGLFQMLHRSRSIQALEIQIGKQGIVRNEKELEKFLSQQPLHAFLPVKQFHLQYELPNIKCKISQRGSFSQKRLCTAIEKFLSLIPLRHKYIQLKKIGYTGELKKIEKELKKEVLELKQLITQQQEKKQLQAEQSSTNTGPPALQSENKLCDLNAILNGAKLSMYLKLNSDSLHKHGDKKLVGYAPLREDLAFFVCNYLLQKDEHEEENKKKKIIRIWDPFCGSGTIGLQFLSTLFQSPIRMNFDSSRIQRIPIFPQAEYDSFKVEIIDEFKQNALSLIENVDFKIMFSDLSYKAVSSAEQNFSQSFLAQSMLKWKPQWSPVEGSARRALAPHLREFEHWGGRLRFTTADFEGAARLLTEKIQQDQRIILRKSKDIEEEANNAGLRWKIVTNIPYAGRRSGDELDALYTRFTKFLLQTKIIEECYVFVELPHGVQKLPPNHFLKVGSVCWNLVQHLQEGGLQIALLQFDRQRSQEAHEKRQIVRFDSRVRLSPEHINQVPRYLVPQSHLSELAVAKKQKIELNVEQKRKDFLQDFAATKKLIEIIKEKLGKRAVRRMHRSVLRRLIHRRRMEALQRIKINKSLTLKSQKRKQEELQNQERVVRTRTKKARILVQGALERVPEQEQSNVFERIQKTLEKKQRTKLLYLKDKKDKKEPKKIPRWN